MIGVIFGVFIVVNGIFNFEFNMFWGIVGIFVGVGIVFVLMVKGDIVVEDLVLMWDLSGKFLLDVFGDLKDVDC